MTIRLRDHMMGVWEQLRYEFTEKRVRALLGDEVVVDSDRAALVLEPRRVVPSYAVPADDVLANIEPGASAPDDGRSPVLHPGIPFNVHSAPGEACAVLSKDGSRRADAFRLDDPALPGYVLLDFAGFDAWNEESERIVSHPRDPYHRVDVRESNRHVRIEIDRDLVAESRRPRVVFETNLPVRFYLPRDDVRVELRPSERRTSCAYKGEASYWSLDAGGRHRTDVLWSYENPLPDMAALTGLVAFFDEFVDVTVDGELRERPRTGISKAIIEGAGISPGELARPD